jgi:hypothetical protein
VSFPLLILPLNGLLIVHEFILVQFLEIGFQLFLMVVPDLLYLFPDAGFDVFGILIQAFFE